MPIVRSGQPLIPTTCRREGMSAGRRLCAVGLSPDSRYLLQTAEDLHDTLGAAIQVVHAVPGEEAFPQRLMDREFAAAMRQGAAREIADLQRAADTRFDVSIETGDVAQAVARYACSAGADPVLVGRAEDRSRDGLHSHTYGIIRDAPCPVLSF